jgi:hypothetical protein
VKVLKVVPAVGEDVGTTGVSVPHHGASEGGLTLGVLHQLIRVGRSDVAAAGALVGGIAGKTDEELGSRTSGALDEALPGVEVVALGSIVAPDVVAARVVVELDEEEVELGLGDHLVHIEELRVKWALRCAGDDLAATSAGDLGAQLVDEGDVSGLVRELDLDIEVESVHHVVAERARSGPAGVDRAVRTPQEVGELDTSTRRRDGVVRVLADLSSYREQDFLPLGMAGSNAAGNLGTLILEIRVSVGLVVQLACLLSHNERDIISEVGSSTY